MTKADMFKLHKEFNGQTISDNEMETMFSHCPSDVEKVNILDFLECGKNERNIYLEEQLKSVFSMLAEDATDAMVKIKKALNFA